MSGPFLLALDQGTTGSTALLVDRELRVVASANREFAQGYPRPGWVEHDGEAIWRSLGDATTACLERAGVDAGAVAAIGITNQRETTALFDRRTSAPAHPFIVWQCRRTADACRALIDDGHADGIRRRTGLVVDAYFSATKLRWLIDHVDGARERLADGDLLFGTVDTWMTHRLTGGAAHVTDATNASRTMLMNLESLQWDDFLVDLFDVPPACLPEIRSSSEVYGTTRDVGFLPDGLPIAGIAGDQQAALFGQACFERGQAKCTFGTGCFLLLHTGRSLVRSTSGLLTTVALRRGDDVTYALEGSAFVGGAAVQWLRDGLGLIDRAADIEALAASVEESGDVCFVPALAGLGAPHWRSDARGVLRGLSRDTHRGHVARAVLEGIAQQNVDLLEAMALDAGELHEVRVDGGAARNDLLMQIQADLLDVPCVRPEVIETTGLGAAALAGLAIGWFDDEDAVARAWRRDRVFEPAMGADRRRRERDKWRRAVEQA